MSLFFIGMFVGIGVGQLAVMGAMMLFYKPARYYDAEPPSWLCLPCYGQWQAAKKLEEESR